MGRFVHLYAQSQSLLKLLNQGKSLGKNNLSWFLIQILSLIANTYLQFLLDSSISLLHVEQHCYDTYGKPASSTSKHIFASHLDTSSQGF